MDIPKFYLQALGAFVVSGRFLFDLTDYKDYPSYAKTRIQVLGLQAEVDYHKIKRACGIDYLLTLPSAKQILIYDGSDVAIINKLDQLSPMLTTPAPTKRKTICLAGEFEEVRQLLPVSVRDDDIQTIDARLLHQFLEVGRDFSTWIKQRITKYNYLENQDFIIFPQNGGKINSSKNTDGRGRPSLEYHLSLDMAKELAMVENNDKGKMARRYFIACEQALQKYLSTPTDVMLSTYELNLISEQGKDIEKIRHTLSKMVDCLERLF